MWIKKSKYEELLDDIESLKDDVECSKYKYEKTQESVELLRVAVEDKKALKYATVQEYYSHKLLNAKWSKKAHVRKVNGWFDISRLEVLEYPFDTTPKIYPNDSIKQYHEWSDLKVSDTQVKINYFVFRPVKFYTPREQKVVIGWVNEADLKIEGEVND